jgi:hypothetical protein
MVGLLGQRYFTDACVLIILFKPEGAFTWASGFSVISI